MGSFKRNVPSRYSPPSLTLTRTVHRILGIVLLHVDRTVSTSFQHLGVGREPASPGLPEHPCLVPQEVLEETSKYLAWRSRILAHWEAKMTVRLCLPKTKPAAREQSDVACTSLDFTARLPKSDFWMTVSPWEVNQHSALDSSTRKLIPAPVTHRHCMR